jgi:hypothetical protein
VVLTSTQYQYHTARGSESGRLVTLDDLADEIQLIKKESSEIGTKVKIRDIEIKKMQESEGEALLPEDSYTFLAITTGKDTS